MESWLQNYSGLVFSICYSMTRDYFQAEDLAQETFLSAYRSLDRFDGQNEKAYLAKIATNKCRDYLKSAGRRIVPAAGETFSVIKDEKPLPEEQLLADEMQSRLKKMCGSLKEPYRSVAEAHFIENKTADQIAVERGKNVKTIQTQIYRARAMLKKLWKEESA